MRAPPEMKLHNGEEVQTVTGTETPVRPQAPEVLMFEPQWWKEEAAAPRTPLPAGAKYHQEETAEDEKPEAAPVVDDAEEEEDAGVRGRRVPELPSIETRRQHNKTHIPYRPWCRHCVEARKPHWPHPAGATAARPADAVPEVHLD